MTDNVMDKSTGENMNANEAYILEPLYAELDHLRALLRAAAVAFRLQRRWPRVMRRVGRRQEWAAAVRPWNTALCSACLRRLRHWRGVAVVVGRGTFIPRPVRLNQRLAPVLRSCSSCPSRERVLIDPCLWACAYPGLPPEGARVYRLEEALDWKPSRAESLKVALVKSPDYPSDVDLRDALTQHFQTPRILCLGDVFSVEKEGEAYWLRVEDGSWEPGLEAAWVQSLGYPVPMLVQMEITSLSQVTEVNAHRPIQQIWLPLLSPQPPFADLLAKLTSLALGARGIGSVASIALTGPSGSGKSYLAQALSGRLQSPMLEVDCLQLPFDAPGPSEARLRLYFQRAATSSPVVLLLRNLDQLGFDADKGTHDPRILSCVSEGLEQLASAPEPVVVIGCAPKLSSLPTWLARRFLMHLHIPALDQSQRTRLLMQLNTGLETQAGAELSQQTPGLVLADFVSLSSVAEHRMYEEPQIGLKTSLLEALRAMQADYAEALGAPKVPDVTWDDVGGLKDAKAALREALASAQSEDAELRVSGVLLHGPPGCGKTLLAKAVARECGMTFLSVKGPELLNMYVGQSEQNVREDHEAKEWVPVFERARSAEPCVLFFDEVDSLAPSRGRAGDSGGVMDRVVSSLLCELDGAGAYEATVFVMAATNRLDLLDTALLRPGRFDKIIYVGLKEDAESQAQVLNALTRKLRINWDGPTTEEIVQAFPSDVSGADIYGIVATAAREAFADAVAALEREGLPDRAEQVSVSAAAVLEAAKTWNGARDFN